jgi:hypothetical protein
MIAFTLAGFMLAVIWLHTGRTLQRRILATVPVILFVMLVVLGAGHLRKSWDLSENRRNSFSRADELALSSIESPLKISVYLAPEDPRLTDFEQNVVRKLRRVLLHLDVDYKAGGRTGLFESDAEHYGEIWYEMNGKKVMERSTIDQVVLEQFTVCRVQRCRHKRKKIHFRVTRSQLIPNGPPEFSMVCGHCLPFSGGGCYENKEGR